MLRSPRHQFRSCGSIHLGNTPSRRGLQSGKQGISLEPAFAVGHLYLCLRTKDTNDHYCAMTTTLDLDSTACFKEVFFGRRSRA